MPLTTGMLQAPLLLMGNCKWQSPGGLTRLARNTRFYKRVAELNNATFSDVSITFPPGVNGHLKYDSNHVYLIIKSEWQSDPDTPLPSATPTATAYSYSHGVPNTL